MELSLLLTEQILALFLMGFAGYLLVKLKLFKTEDSQVISKLIVYIISPCVIVNSFRMEFSEDKMRGWIIAAAGAAIVHILLIGGGKLLEKPLHLNGIEKASLEYSNAGNLIVPLVTSVLGPEWVFYSTAYMMVQTLLVWTHGLSVIRQEKERSIKKIISNPNIIAIIMGFVLFITNLWFPPVVSSCISGFGAMIGPSSMLVIGMLIGDVDLLWVFRQKRPYLICFLRLVGFPLLVILLFGLSGLTKLHPDGKYILLIVLLAASAPAAAMVTQLAQIYKKDARYASVINIMSVIFCVVTMPLIVFLYNIII